MPPWFFFLNINFISSHYKGERTFFVCVGFFLCVCVLLGSHLWQFFVCLFLSNSKGCTPNGFTSKDSYPLALKSVPFFFFDNFSFLNFCFPFFWTSYWLQCSIDILILLPFLLLFFFFYLLKDILYFIFQTFPYVLRCSAALFSDPKVLSYLLTISYFFFLNSILFLFHGYICSDSLSGFVWSLQDLHSHWITWGRGESQGSYHIVWALQTNALIFSSEFTCHHPGGICSLKTGASLVPSTSRCSFLHFAKAISLPHAPAVF